MNDFLRILFTFILFSTVVYNGQVTTGEIKELTMNSNNVSVLIFNYGSLGYPNRFNEMNDVYWKGLGYLGEFGPIIAGEVTGENGETLHICSDSFVLPMQGDYSSDGSVKWGWMPRAGYAAGNQKEIANKLNPDSWPPEWQSWQGDLEEGLLNEAFFVMDDFNNAEFNYNPFPQETEKKGLGVSSEVRIFQFELFPDAVIVQYKLKNESPRSLQKLFFGLQGDPHVGGPRNWSDDRTSIVTESDLAELPLLTDAKNTIYCWDDDMTGDNNLTSGYLGFKLLNTPDDIGLTSFHAAAYTNSDPNVPRNDELMWHWFSDTTIDLSQPLIQGPGDNIINFGTGPFTLEPGEEKIVELALFLSEDYDDMLTDASYLQVYRYWTGLKNELSGSGGDSNYKVELENLSNKYSGEIDLKWNYTGNSDNARIFIDISSNSGRIWMPIVKALSVNDAFSWSSDGFRDGVNYLARVIAYNPDNPREYYFDVMDNKFTIDNPGVNALPEVSFIEDPSGRTLSKSPYLVRWFAGDADNNNLHTEIETANYLEGPYTKLEVSDREAGQNSFLWDINSISNYDSYFLRIVVSDGTNETVITSDRFSINTQYGVYPQSTIEHISGNSTAIIKVNVADPNLLNNDEYQISFEKKEGELYLDINRVSDDELLLNGFKIIEGLSTPLIEGVKIEIIDNPADLNYELTGFNRTELNSYYDVFFESDSIPVIGTPHIKIEDDWIIVFNNFETDNNNNWTEVGDIASAFSSSGFIDAVCPFSIINVDNNEQANYLIDELNSDNPANGQWDYGERIILRPQDAVGTEVSYAIDLLFDSGSSLKPLLGDTLFISTYNSLDEEDVYGYRTDNDYTVSVPELSKLKMNFHIYQNYPNPFNPVTTIQYEIPKPGLVSIKVYDSLGQEVENLLHNYQQTGVYSIRFNGANMTSGIYFCRIQSGSYSDVIKMLLLK